MKNNKIPGLSQLGSGKTEYVFEYCPSLLECFDNKNPNADYFIQINCAEFTSLCPMTGQPDHATIQINYVPDKKLVESKSLKLYLFSFRNRGDFSEDIINIINNDLIDLMNPKYIEVIGNFTPRGGISICPFVNFGQKDTKWESFAEKRFAMFYIK